VAVTSPTRVQLAKPNAPRLVIAVEAVEPAAVRRFAQFIERPDVRLPDHARPHRRAALARFLARCLRFSPAVLGLGQFGFVRQGAQSRTNPVSEWVIGRPSLRARIAS
jgi:hypothetical protein